MTTSVDFTGTWKNQHGSKLKLAVLNNVVSGEFESGVGDDGKTLWVDVNGRVLGDLIAFVTVYEKYGTVIAWVGQHVDENGIGSIRTHWIHATNVPDNQEQEWMWYSNRIGADVFTRV